MDTIDATVQIWIEGNQYIAHAMPLDVASSGPTPAAARLALTEAVRLFLSTAKEAGTLDELLEECGYERNAEGWRSPTVLAVERESLAMAV
jgi:hypothetical protein